MRRTVVAGATISLCTALLVPSSAAQSPPPLAAPALVRYEDPVGDTVGGIGPDIVAVTLSPSGSDGLDIAIQFATEPPLTYDTAEGWTDMLMILGSVGPQGVVPVEGGLDADFATGLHGAALEWSIGTGAPLNIGDRIIEGAVPVAVDGATVTLTLSRKALGDPERILFVMGTTREGLTDDAASGGDEFPDDPADGPSPQVAWTFATAGASDAP